MRKTLGVVCKGSGAFCELLLVPEMLKVEDLERNPRDFAILLPVSMLGLYQVLPMCVQADEDLAAWSHRLQ